MTFSLYGNPTDQLRLVAFGVEMRNGKRTVTIEIEASSAYHVAYALESLERVAAGQQTEQAGEENA